MITWHFCGVQHLQKINENIAACECLCCRISSFPTGIQLIPRSFSNRILTTGLLHQSITEIINTCRELCLSFQTFLHIAAHLTGNGKFGVIFCLISRVLPILGVQNVGKNLQDWMNPDSDGMDKNTGNVQGLSFRPLLQQVVMLHFWSSQTAWNLVLFGTPTAQNTCYQLELGTKHWKS